MWTSNFILTTHVALKISVQNRHMYYCFCMLCEYVRTYMIFRVVYVDRKGKNICLKHLWGSVYHIFCTYFMSKSVQLNFNIVMLPGMVYTEHAQSRSNGWNKVLIQPFSVLNYYSQYIDQGHPFQLGLTFLGPECEFKGNLSKLMNAPSCRVVR